MLILALHDALHAHHFTCHPCTHPKCHTEVPTMCTAVVYVLCADRNLPPRLMQLPVPNLPEDQGSEATTPSKTEKPYVQGYTTTARYKPLPATLPHKGVWMQSGRDTPSPPCKSCSMPLPVVYSLHADGNLPTKLMQLLVLDRDLNQI